MYHSRLKRIVANLKGKDNLIQFLEQELGYKTTPVFYEATDLKIPLYLAKEVKGWWLVSHYPGDLPFQVHLLQIRELTFNFCRKIIDSFSRQHPGYSLFIFTKDYSYLLFITIEWSLERRPWPGRSIWPKLPKPYYRFLLMNRAHPTSNDLEVLNQLRADLPRSDPALIYQKVVEALKLSEHWGGLPEWFMPWYYRLGFSPRLWEKLRRSGEI